MTSSRIFRAGIFHLTGSPWARPDALSAFDDGGLLVTEGRVVACDAFDVVRTLAPDAPVTDWRGGYLVPGFVDAHVHFAQLRILGRPGPSLLEWLDEVALPEERRMADLAYATDTAERFVRALASHGTTTASVFGAHFAAATAALFDAAARSGLRIASGLVLADRGLHGDLHTTPRRAYDESAELIRRFHGAGRLRYSLTPRFALSTSDALLEACGALVADHPSIRCQSHLNENVDEVAQVRRLFPWADDYLSVYERFGLSGHRTLFAHDVHATPSELDRLAATGTAVAHCPSSNAALGSGIFPMRRHLAAGVRFALGSDVGAGTGFSVPREALQAALMQRVASEPVVLTAAHMLYLSTLAGAEALGLDEETGNFAAGRSADFVLFRPPESGVLAVALDRADSRDDVFAALVTLGGPEAIREVRVAGDVVFSPAVADAARHSRARARPVNR